MSRRFVIEAVMVAIYGELLLPSEPVTYIVPYTSLMELYEFRHSPESLMTEPEDDRHVKQIIDELITYIEQPLNHKKIQKALQIPWTKSPSILLSEKIELTVINALDTAQFGEFMDPVETELVLTSQREGIPILTDQIEFIERIISAQIPVEVYDINDFQFAVEQFPIIKDPL
ncbi:ADP-heptose synthase [Paenibacillus sediminis]|uniref:ADP-heptose synthase n=1 Tax=Paenibacillus sediminis TaxID=664909 RepID=A0ABS4H2I0_9BACL|nr:ADP-heptose synthase [Paenibacillus sediminis]MBP1936325.1 hypothetical protein [Paenibacillus sediminis]